MKVALVLPGSGDAFYCENCVRDAAVARALAARGHDVAIVPMYLPLFSDGAEAAGDAPIFFGGVNAWLQQNVALFRRTPRAVDRLLDAPWVLRLAARRAGSTRAGTLGPMTLSMLRGERGNQSKEVGRLAAHLAAQRPDVVHLSNALLLGLSGPLRERTGAAVACTLQDEAPWMDALGDPYGPLCWEEARRAARETDAFVATSRFYAASMGARLGLEPGRVRVVPPGIDASPYVVAPAPPDPPAVGFMARLCARTGLDLLASAFAALKASHPALRLLVTGGSTADDAPFLRGVRSRLSAAGLAGDAEFLPRFDRESRVRFLSRLSVLSVPGTEETAFGLYLLEAMASGVPVVQPRAGAFPEIVEAAGCGLLVPPGDVDALAGAIDGLLRDPARARAMGRAGREAVLGRFSLEGMAEGLSEVYEAARERRR